MQQQLVRNLQPYVTSSFSRHGLTPTVGIVASLAGGVSQFPLAKILNVFGRMECYIIVHILCTVGLILMAVARSVETYAAALVILFMLILGPGKFLMRTLTLGLLDDWERRYWLCAHHSDRGHHFAPKPNDHLYHQLDRIHRKLLRWACCCFALLSL